MQSVYKFRPGVANLQSTFYVIERHTSVRPKKTRNLTGKIFFFNIFTEKLLQLNFLLNNMNKFNLKSTHISPDIISKFMSKIKYIIMVCKRYTSVNFVQRISIIFLFIRNNREKMLASSGLDYGLFTKPLYYSLLNIFSKLPLYNVTNSLGIKKTSYTQMFSSNSTVFVMVNMCIFLAWI